MLENLLNDIQDYATSETISNIWFHNYDFDQTSGYPSDSVAANLSKTTTKKELLGVEGVDKDTFKRNNINLMFGPINSPMYCVEMMNAPTLQEIMEKVTNKLAFS